MPGIKNFDPKKDVPDLAGKVILITGGTSGVGAAAVIELARHNPAHLLFTGRNAKSAEATISSARSSAAAAAGANAAEAVVLVPITFIECDLASLVSVKAAADKVLALVERLDVLVCNAGIMAQPAALSPDGYEIHFATNHLGHALLTLKLLPLLEHTSTATTTAGTANRARIIMISSAAWKSGAPPGGIVFDTLKTPQEMGLGGRWLRYGQSKLANLLWARELSARHPSVLSFSVTPGVVATGSVAAFGLADKLLVYVANAGRVKTVEEGAHNLLWAVGVSAVAGDGDGDGDAVQGGGFYEPVGAPSVLQSKASRDPALAGRLWEWTLAELKPFL